MVLQRVYRFPVWKTEYHAAPVLSICQQPGVLPLLSHPLFASPLAPVSSFSPSSNFRRLPSISTDHSLAHSCSLSLSPLPSRRLFSLSLIRPLHSAFHPPFSSNFFPRLPHPRRIASGALFLSPAFPPRPSLFNHPSPSALSRPIFLPPSDSLPCSPLLARSSALLRLLSPTLSSIFSLFLSLFLFRAEYPNRTERILRPCSPSPRKAPENWIGSR